MVVWFSLGLLEERDAQQANGVFLMRRKIIGVIVGLVVAFVVNVVVTVISSLVYKMPDGLSMNDMEAMKAWINTLPLVAFAFVIAGHVLSSFAGAFACAAIVRKPWIIGTLIIAGLLLSAGVVNLISIPHPMWFGFVDLILYVPSAFAGLALACHLFRCDCEVCVENENSDNWLAHH